MSTQIREIAQIIQPQPVVEGAGVHLKRSIATRTLSYIDPFLLFDHFGSDNPADYLPGFPMHPHRGIETVTYMLDGYVRHKDSLGNTGEIGRGDLQWMTAGKGILHEEMPQPRDGKMEGFQLWVNLPARLKMTQPRYQEIPSSAIPEVKVAPGVQVRIIAGHLEGIQGAVTDIAAEPTYLDVSLQAGNILRFPLERSQSAFVYLISGRCWFGSMDRSEKPVTSPKLVIFDAGDLIYAQAEKESTRFLLVAGQPLNEPIARYGPFVMNTWGEIEQTLQELRDGTFIS